MARDYDDMTAPTAQKSAVDAARPAGRSNKKENRPGILAWMSFIGSILGIVVSLGRLLPPSGAQPEPPPPAFSTINIHKEYTSIMANDFTTTSTACATSCGLPTDDAELRKLLTPEQYKIMRENGTEAPFRNEYWNNKAEGLYVDRISGRPLFSSRDKFDSGTGWPSFTKPLHPEEVKEIEDRSHGMVRTEVRSASSDSHLGHVFDDGPPPTYIRYCMNSASLKFIPVDKLAEEGLSDYLPLFGRGGAEAKASQNLQQAMFGAGCFWGVEETFRTTPGVLETEVGYAGGHTENPTYREVCSDTTGHAEVVRVTYDPAKVSYDQLLDIFWKNHNPTQLNRQGPDVGSQYRSVIFTYSPEQEKAASESMERLAMSGRYGKPIVTQIVAAAPFHRAEEYHQKYLLKQGRTACH